MLTLADLDQRRSAPTRQLQAPGPDDAQLLRILQTAVRVPDHGKRVPFRFLRIAGQARTRLAEAAVTRLLEREPASSEAVVAKLRDRFLLPPMTLAVVVITDPEDTIPEVERRVTASQAALMLMLAAQAEGFGAQLLTGWLTYDRPFLEQTLGLAAHEALVGTIGIGRVSIEIPERERPDAAALLSDLQP